MTWSNILENITNTVDIVGKLAKNINEAINSGFKIYDLGEMRRLQTKLKKMQGAFNSLDSLKRYNISDLKDYLSKDPTAPSWSDLQTVWGQIHIRLKAVLSLIETQDSTMVEGLGFDEASALGAALQKQARIYGELPKMPEPSTSSDRDIVKRVLVKVTELVENVVKLEGNIQTYLRKFSA